MKTIQEIRVDNARMLADSVGSNTAFSEKIDRETTQTSRFIGKNPTKAIGDIMARHIESCFNLPIGWLDQNRESGISEPQGEYKLNNEVPVFTLDQLSDNKKNHATAICPSKHSNSSFGVIVEGNNNAATPMHPSYGLAYPVGSIVFADPDKINEVKNGDPVIARVPSRNAVTFRMYYNEGGSELLLPLNPQFPPVTEKFEIIAKVISAILPQR